MWHQASVISSAVFGRDSACTVDDKAIGDSLFEVLLEKACSAPLEKAAAAFAGLGTHVAADVQDVSPACLQNGLVCCQHCDDQHCVNTQTQHHLLQSHRLTPHWRHTLCFLCCWCRIVLHRIAYGPGDGLESLARAMRRRDVLQRADDLVPHSVGRVLLVLANTAVVDRIEGSTSVKCSAPAYHVHPRRMFLPVRAEYHSLTSTGCLSWTKCRLAADCYRHIVRILNSRRLTLAPHPCRSIEVATIPGALQILRIGTTLAARPASSARRIEDCTLLAMSHPVAVAGTSRPTGAGAKCFCLTSRTVASTTRASAQA